MAGIAYVKNVEIKEMRLGKNNQFYLPKNLSLQKGEIIFYARTNLLLEMWSN